MRAFAYIWAYQQRATHSDMKSTDPNNQWNQMLIYTIFQYSHRNLKTYKKLWCSSSAEKQAISCCTWEGTALREPIWSITNHTCGMYKCWIIAFTGPKLMLADLDRHYHYYWQIGKILYHFTTGKIVNHELNWYISPKFTIREEWIIPVSLPTAHLLIWMSRMESEMIIHTAFTIL